MLTAISHPSPHLLPANINKYVGGKHVDAAIILCLLSVMLPARAVIDTQCNIFDEHVGLVGADICITEDGRVESTCFHRHIDINENDLLLPH